MSERILDLTVLKEKELAYQKLCEFERNYCESIYKSSKGLIVYEINPARLAELENATESDLQDFKDLDFSITEFPSYQKLFEAKYKVKFLKNIAAINPHDLHKKLGRNTLKEIDLDNDGVPDRIDIDDTKNYVQTVADLDIVKNSTNKETSEDKKKKKKERQKENNMEH